jgi:hypothetical protein
LTFFAIASSILNAALGSSKSFVFQEVLSNKYDGIKAVLVDMA